MNDHSIKINNNKRRSKSKDGGSVKSPKIRHRMKLDAEKNEIKCTPSMCDSSINELFSNSKVNKK